MKKIFGLMMAMVLLLTGCTTSKPQQTTFNVLCPTGAPTLAWLSTYEEITETGDFIVNEKEKQVNLTEDGVRKVEQFFHIENLADAENLEIQHNIILALRAHNLMFRDQNYVVTEDGQVYRTYHAGTPLF